MGNPINHIELMKKALRKQRELVKDPKEAKKLLKKLKLIK